ncbi:MAG: acyltransferase, partial [Thermoleophilia bacterium]|nr:acyltransferase [Thermoleophilia bacterium]
GKYRKQHIPQTKGFWEKFYFTPGTGGYPVFDTAVGKVGVVICYDRHFPEIWRELGLQGAQIVFNPSATVESLSRYLWELEQTASAAANGYWVGAINRVGVESPISEHKFYGSSYFANPKGQIVAQANDTDDAIVVTDIDLDEIQRTRDTWQFFRDRRPETYAATVNPALP